jgi:hypothetical protein
MIFERFILLRWGSIMCKQVQVSAISSESRDLSMAGRVRFSEIVKGLVPAVDKSRSVIGAVRGFRTGVVIAAKAAA